MPGFGARIEVVSEEMAALLRQKTGAERLAIAIRMFISARWLLLSRLRSAHPEWDDRQTEGRPLGGCRMEQSELLRFVGSVLERLGLRYGVSGLAGSIDSRSSSIVRPANISCRSVE